MSYNISPDSDLVGIGYIETEFSNAYPVSNSALNVLFGEAGKNIDIIARILGDLAAYHYSIDVNGVLTSFANNLGDVTEYTEPSPEVSGYPDATPSSISNGIAMLQDNIGDMGFPSQEAYWNDSASIMLQTPVQSVSDEISWLEQKNIGVAQNNSINPIDINSILRTLNPVEQLGQIADVYPVIPNHIAGIAPMSGVIGFEDYGYSGTVSGVVIPTTIYTGAIQTPGNWPVFSIPVSFSSASGIYPQTIDERLRRLNTYENALKSVLIGKFSYYNGLTLEFSGSNTSRTFIVPNGVPIDYLDFEIWGGGGGGGRAIAIRDSTGDLRDAKKNTASSGTGGGPGGHVRIYIKGFGANDKFILHTGKGGSTLASIKGEWHIGIGYAGSTALQTELQTRRDSEAGGASTITYYRWDKNTSSYGSGTVIVTAGGGGGGFGGAGRCSPGQANLYSSGPNIGSATYNLAGTGLVIEGTVSANQPGVTTGEGNSAVAFVTEDYSQPNPYPTSYSSKPSKGRGWYMGGNSRWNFDKGRGGEGGNAASIYDNVSNVWDVDNPTTGSNGTAIIRIKGYTYAPNVGGVDQSWLSWQQTW